VVIGIVAAALLRPRPVAVEPASPSGAAAAACRALHDALPSQVGGLAGRPTTPASATTAAWGDTPILLRCGVGRPAGLEPTSELTTVDGVDWFPQQLTHGYRFTTVGRTAFVEVTVPDADGPEVRALVDLAPAVTHAVPATGS
jgi:uncharacterized protein DUF3515